jgi:hypothetical protein
MRTQIRVARDRSRIVSILVIFKTHSPSCCTSGSAVVGVLALFIFFDLSDKISDARWLTEAEKNILTSNLHTEKEELYHFADAVRVTASGSWSGLSSPSIPVSTAYPSGAPRKNSHARHGRTYSSGAPTSL